MAFTVRIYGCAGLARLPVVQDGGTIGSDSVYVLNLPLLWTQALTTNGTTPVNSTIAPVPANHTIDPTRMLRVEVPDGQSIRYEVNATGIATSATTNSPLLTGRDNIVFGPNWILSIIDATGT